MNTISNVLLIAAVVTGIARFRALTGFFRIFVVVLVFGLLTVCLSEYVIQVLKKASNNLVSNLFVLFETSFLLYAASLTFTSPAARLSILFAGVGAGSFWIIESYINGVVNFSSYTYLAECTCLILVYVVIMYRAVLSSNDPLKNAVFWIGAGVVVNAGCNIPFFCLFYYLQNHHLTISKMLFQIIQVATTLQYLCCIVAFLLYKPATPNMLNGK